MIIEGLIFATQGILGENFYENRNILGPLMFIACMLCLINLGPYYYCIHVV